MKQPSEKCSAHSERRRSASTRRKAPGLGMRIMARVTLACFLASPVQAGRRHTTETFLGNATTRDGIFTENTRERTTFDQFERNAIVRWDRDIQQPAFNTLSFIQKQNESVLNQMPGVDTSHFAGTVQCGGTCVFVNEAGITFDDGSFIDVGRIFAVAGRISDQEFRAGDFHFTDLHGEVQNYGTIEADSAALIGARVGNHGNITIRDGTLAMLAGGEVWLREHGSPVVIHAPLPSGETPRVLAGIGMPPAIENTGSIDAGRGRVRLAASDLLSFAIRSSGSITAASIELDGGGDGFVEVSGSLDASDRTAGEVGGTIEVTGDVVAIIDDALLDASGAAGGGSIRVGGDVGGGGKTRTARHTFVGEDVTLRADAEEKGKGGSVVVWANEVAQVYGSIQARGGVEGGSGGFVETSGKRFLDLGASPPDVRARSGDAADTGGEWLLDPLNITIVDDLTPTCGTEPACMDDQLREKRSFNPVFLFDPEVAPTVTESRISASAIVKTLERGSSITITTAPGDDASGDVAKQEGNIIVNAAILIEDSERVNAGAESKLTLLAANNIEVNAEIRNDSPDMELSVQLVANDPAQFELDLITGQPIETLDGDVLLNAAITTGGGDISIQATNIFQAIGAKMKTDGGFFSVTADGGNAEFRATIDTSSSDSEEDGGSLFIQTNARRFDFDNDSATPSEIRGGLLTIERDLTSGGGEIQLTSDGGILDISAGDVLQGVTIDSGGGIMRLQSQSRPFFPGTPEEDTIIQGGLINLSAESTIRTAGGRLEIGRNTTQLAIAADEIRILGKIDTTSNDPTETGGDILINTSQPDSRTVIFDQRADRFSAQIVTGGGDFISDGEGAFFLNSSIDTRAPTGNEFAEEDLGMIVIDEVGVIDIIDPSDPLLPSLAADTRITITTDANIRFQGSAPGSLDLAADEIGLFAGDGPGGATQNRVEGIEFLTLSDSSRSTNPERFNLSQDASIDTTDDLSGQNLTEARFFEGHVRGLEYELVSGDGSIHIDARSHVAGSDLSLNAKTGVTFGEALSTDPLEALVTLSITVNDDFDVNSTLAGQISGSAPEIELLGGQGLRILGDLEASDRLFLHAGRVVEGDLELTNGTNGIVLRSNDLTLRAGNAGLASASKVVVPDAVMIDRADDTKPWSFTLRQDASIVDDTIPEAGQFRDSGGNQVAFADTPIHYTLRSDSGRLTVEDATKLDQTHLSLHARSGIDLALAKGNQLTVRSLDIGGLSNFTYTQELDDKINLLNPDSTDPDSGVLTLRAGLEATGDLSFAGSRELDDDGQPIPFVIHADKIRLMAGDGVGDASGSSILLFLDPDDPVTFEDANPNTSGPIDQFVFRQDGDIDQGQLPTLEDTFAGERPNEYAIQADSGSLRLLDFEAATVPQANEKLVLAGRRVDLSRNDDRDLDLDVVFKLGAGSQLEIRADEVLLRATASGDPNPGGDPVVLPGNNFHISGFSAIDEDAPEIEPLLPEGFDFSSAPARAPDTITIEQTATIGLENLVDLESEVEPNLPDEEGEIATIGYELRSLEGGIDIAPHFVNGSDLFMNAEGETSTIRFCGSDGVCGPDSFAESRFLLNSLNATTQSDWEIVHADGAKLVIDAQDSIELRGGSSGAGDLRFGPDVVLVGKRISLAAGNLSAFSADPEKPPIVDARGNAPSFFFRDDPNAEADAIVTEFQIQQDGSFIGPNETPSTGVGRIPDPEQIHDAEEREPIPGELDPSPLDEMRLLTSVGDIIFDDLEVDLGNKTKRIDFSTPATSSLISLGSAGATTEDLDLARFDTVNLFGFEIVLTGGDGRLVKAASEDVTFSSARFRIVQNGRNIDEDPTDCLDGCLPDIEQFIGGIAGIDYTLEARNAEITFNNAIAEKMVAAELTLLAPKVTLNADSDLTSHRLADIFLGSLTVGASNDPVDIVITSEAAGNDPEPKVTQIATDRFQIYFGDVTFESHLDGGGAAAFEATGEIIQFTGNIDAAPNTVSDLTANVRSQFSLELDLDPSDPDNPIDIGIDEDARSRARFDGDVHFATDPANETTSRIRINLQPRIFFTDTEVRFGVNTTTETFVPGASPQSIEADLIEIVAVADLEEPDVFTERSPIVATIYKNKEDLTIAARRFTMGPGERFSVAANLRIGGTAFSSGTPARSKLLSLGDLNALILELNADTIEFNRRRAGRYLQPDGSFGSDAGVDVVANQIILNTNQLGSVGEGKRPVFAVQKPGNAPKELDGFPLTAIAADGSGITAADFTSEFNIALLDLHPEGPSRDDISTVYWRDGMVPVPGAWIPDGWLPDDESNLAALRIASRSTRPSEFQSRLAGATIIDDTGTDLLRRPEQRFEIAETRILTADATEAAGLHRKLFGDEEAVERTRVALQGALDRYRATTNARRVLGFELRRYLRNRPSSEFDAYLALEELDSLFAYHRHLGLTPGEYEPIQREWLTRIKPRGITVEELAEAIHPSRFVRGSDILDIFGE